MADPRRHLRLALGPGAVLSVSMAAELLPGDDSGNSRELYALGLVRRWRGRDCVLWGEVLATIGDAPARPEEAPDGLVSQLVPVAEL